MIPNSINGAFQGNDTSQWFHSGQSYSMFASPKRSVIYDLANWKTGNCKLRYNNTIRQSCSEEKLVDVTGFEVYPYILGLWFCWSVLWGEQPPISTLSLKRDCKSCEIETWTAVVFGYVNAKPSCTCNHMLNINTAWKGKLKLCTVEPKLVPEIQYPKTSKVGPSRGLELVQII